MNNIIRRKEYIHIQVSTIGTNWQMMDENYELLKVSFINPSTESNYATNLNLKAVLKKIFQQPPTTISSTAAQPFQREEEEAAILYSGNEWRVPKNKFRNIWQHKTVEVVYPLIAHVFWRVPLLSNTTWATSSPFEGCLQSLFQT